MNDSASQLGYLRDPRLSAHAIAAAPAWLWSVDATRILWANAVGAAIFDADTPAALATRHFEADDPAAQQIARIAAALPLDGIPRLERLSGFGAEASRTLTCGCSRISLPDGTAAILVVAAEVAGPALSLEERVQRLVTGLRCAGRGLRRRRHAVSCQSACGRTARRRSDVSRRSAPMRWRPTPCAPAMPPARAHIGALSFERIGNDAATFLIATLPTAQRAAPQPPVFAPSPVVSAPEAEADVFAREATDEEAVSNDTPTPVETSTPRRAYRGFPNAGTASAAALRLADGW